MKGIAERAATLAGGTLAEARRVAGGSLSQVLRLRLADGRELIAKHGAAGGLLLAQADMLRAIRATGAPAPEVFGADTELLVMAAVASDGRLEGGSWQNLADALARLHAPGEAPYGWPENHAFGKVAILNAPADDWTLFWGERRLRCHVPHVDVDLGHRLEGLADRLGGLVPAHPPSVLLHGDLWGGNVLVGDDGRITLIDPACYRGDREVDVAMLTLFDHPPQRFFDALALAPGWRDRLPLYRLWPLLVHLRLFGGGYRTQVCDMLDRVGV